MAKAYIATKGQVDNVQTTVNEINTKVTPVGLSNVIVNVVDFIHDQVTITSGGLNSNERIIST